MKKMDTYADIIKVMHVLPQEGQIENYFLTKNLAPQGTTSVSTHYFYGGTNEDQWFSLIVDDFGVKYVGKQETEHLITCIPKYYPVSVDWTGGLCCGVSLY